MTGTHGVSSIHPLVASACLLACMLAAGPSTAAGATPSTQRWRLALSLGGQYWPTLADLQPATGGSFDSAGMVAEVAFHGPAPFGKGWLLGLDAGVSYTQGSVTGLQTDMDANTLYLTPSVKIPLKGTPLFLDLGLGYYRVDFSEVDCSLWYYEGCVDLGERWSKNTVGGYVGATWEIPMGETGGNIALSLRVNYVDFGTPGSIGPSPGQLDGPSTVFLVGFSF